VGDMCCVKGVSWASGRRLLPRILSVFNPSSTHFSERFASGVGVSWILMPCIKSWGDCPALGKEEKGQSWEGELVGW